MKDGIRILGIDDAAFNFEDNSTFLTGVVYRGTEFIEEIETIEIGVDSEDASKKVGCLYNKFNTIQIKAILLDGISFAGFNIADLEEIADQTEIPVIAVTKNQPDREKFRKTMKETENYDKAFEKLGQVKKVELPEGEVFIQFSGCSEDEAEEFIRMSTLNGLIPEPIRVADMLGRAFPN